MAIVLRHADVDALGRDPRLVGVGLGNFDVMGITDGPLRDWYGQLMFTNEGAVHRRLRSLVQKAFTPRPVAGDPRRRRPRWPTEAYGRFASRGRAISSPRRPTLPLRVICRLIGVPDADVARFVDWADALSIVFGFVIARAGRRGNGRTREA